jgi:hypothetical protein
MPVTQYPRIWFNFLCSPLRTWERAAIDAWASKTDVETRGIVQSQIQQINLAQRSAAGKVVNLYYIKSGTTPGEFRHRLAVGRDGVNVGKVEMTVDGEKVVCQLLAVDGRLFSLEFDRLPRRRWRRPRVRVDAVIVSMLQLKPKPEELRTYLPYDYVDVAARREFLPDKVSLFDFDEIYASTFEEGRFWLFAEIPDVGMLGTRVDDADRRVYLLNYDGCRSLELGLSLEKALKRIREGGN